MEIKKIILYNRGLGFFSRHDKIDMSTQKKLQLSFKTNVMNDLLKTLSIICSSGVVTGVSYEAADVDTERALEDALIKVPEIDSFISLIKQLIGTQIEVSVGSRTLKGKVLGVQEIEEEGTKDNPRVEREKRLERALYQLGYRCLVIDFLPYLSPYPAFLRGSVFT